MERVTDNNYYQVSGWMIKRLGLKGVKLSIFAIIYSFSQDRESDFHGSNAYLSEFTGASKRAVITALQELCAEKLIIKSTLAEGGTKRNRYFANWSMLLPIINGSYDGLKNAREDTKSLPDEVQKVHQGGEETSPEGVKKLHRGGEKTSPNNKDNNKDIYKAQMRIDGQEAERNKDDNTSALIQQFNCIWEKYPRKCGRKQAFEAFKRAVKKGVPPSVIERGLENYINAIKRSCTEPEYIMHGSTWFNGWHWDDEYDTDSAQASRYRRME